MSTESFYDIEVQTLAGERTTLEPYRGRVLLVVNTASQCGLTPQYEGLEALHRRFHDRGFAVLGFPCNQFLGQEPGTAEDIRTFCDTRYDVTFPMHAKIEVNGRNAHPLYRYLKGEKKGFLGTSAIKWNFTKFLVDGEGRVVERFGSSTPPAALSGAIEKLLS